MASKRNWRLLAIYCGSQSGVGKGSGGSDELAGVSATHAEVGKAPHHGSLVCPQNAIQAPRCPELSSEAKYEPRSSYVKGLPLSQSLKVLASEISGMIVATQKKDVKAASVVMNTRSEELSCRCPSS